MDSRMVIEVVALMIPICGILVLPFCIWILVKAYARRHEEVQLTLRKMIENGQPLSPELIDKLATGGKPPQNLREKDLRWGVILTAIGLAIAVSGVFDEGFGPRARLDSVLESIGFGAFFVIVGLARLGLWKFAPREEPSSVR